MTQDQMRAIYRYLTRVRLGHDQDQPLTVAHHGDCVGGDAEFHVIATVLGYWTIAHPPTNPTRRAWCKAFETSWGAFELDMPHRHAGHAISIAGHGTPSWMRAKTGHVGVAEWRKLMEIGWMTREQLTEAVPPAYGRHMGELLMTEAFRP